MLGVAESFKRSDRRSVLAGVVMRGDLVVDGVAFGWITVGGMDATEGVASLYRALSRNDINALMLSGCVLSHYNVVDVDLLARNVEVPVVCLSYNETRGIEDAIRRAFPRGSKARLAVYSRLGGRQPVRLRSGYTIYVRVGGIARGQATRLVDRFTLQGSIPEPVRLAKQAARAAARFARSLRQP